MTEKKIRIAPTNAPQIEIGSCVLIDNDLYILALTRASAPEDFAEVTLINLENGNRYSEPVKVAHTQKHVPLRALVSGTPPHTSVIDVAEIKIDIVAGGVLR